MDVFKIKIQNLIFEDQNIYKKRISHEKEGYTDNRLYKVYHFFQTFSIQSVHIPLT